MARFELEREDIRILLRLSLTVIFFREKNQILLSCKEITLTNSLKDERKVINEQIAELCCKKGSFYCVYKYSYLESEKRTPENSYIFLE